MSIGFEYSNPPILFKETAMEVRVIEVLQKIFLIFFSAAEMAVAVALNKLPPTSF